MADYLYSIDQMVAAMKQEWTSSRTDYKAIADNYYQSVRRALIRGIHMANPMQVKFGLIPVSFQWLATKCKRYGSKGQQKYWFYWLHQHFPLMQVKTRGNNLGRTGELTMVTITRQMEAFLLPTNDRQDQAEIFAAYYQDLVDHEIDWVPIDRVSLGHYIRHTEDSLKYLNRGDQYRKSLENNLKQARLVKIISNYCGGQLPQAVKRSPFGRKYYTGPNLQNLNKNIRHAALGSCYVYDIEASVFTWKFDLAKELEPAVKLPATLEFLDWKDHHRTRLAQLLFGNTNDYSIKTIKLAITAVGFGARATNNYWQLQDGSWQTTSLNQLIRSKEKIKLLFSDPWFKEFVQEQDLIGQLIFSHVRESLQHLDILKNSRGSLSKNKTMSYLYQQTEARIIQALEARLRHQGQEILLICHDGFYTKQPADIVDLRYELQQWLPHGRLDQKTITPFRYHPESQEDLRNHQRFIQQEEQAVAEILRKPVHKSQPLPRVWQQRNEEFDGGYDDGSQAYQEPDWNKIPDDILDMITKTSDF